MKTKKKMGLSTIAAALAAVMLFSGSTTTFASAADLYNGPANAVVKITVSNGDPDIYWDNMNSIYNNPNARDEMGKIVLAPKASTEFRPAIKLKKGDFAVIQVACYPIDLQATIGFSGPKGFKIIEHGTLDITCELNAPYDGDYVAFMANNSDQPIDIQFTYNH